MTTIDTNKELLNLQTYYNKLDSATPRNEDHKNKLESLKDLCEIGINELKNKNPDRLTMFSVYSQIKLVAGQPIRKQPNEKR